MRAKIETQDRYKALFLSEQGYSLRQIAEQLGRPHSCVSNILKRYNETGCIKLIFQQDNAPCHTAKIINNRFDERT